MYLMIWRTVLLMHMIVVVAYVPSVLSNTVRLTNIVLLR